MCFSTYKVADYQRRMTYMLSQRKSSWDSSTSSSYFWIYSIYKKDYAQHDEAQCMKFYTKRCGAGYAYRCWGHDSAITWLNSVKHVCSFLRLYRTGLRHHRLNTIIITPQYSSSEHNLYTYDGEIPTTNSMKTCHFDDYYYRNKRVHPTTCIVSNPIRGRWIAIYL